MDVVKTEKSSSFKPTKGNVLLSLPIRAYQINSWSWNQFVIKLKPLQTLSRELLATSAQEVSPQFLIHNLVTLNEQHNGLLFTQYTTAITSSILAALTFFLATIGLYGILNYATQMRRFELGTRMAIGAKRKDIVWLIVKENAWNVVLGMSLSLVVMLALYLVYKTELAAYLSLELVPVFGITVFAIALLSLFACYWPLRRYIPCGVVISI
jgi:ABC-type antimicrobial peptide transport system permease subunit